MTPEFNTQSFNNYSFLHYPELRTLLNQAKNHPDAKISFPKILTREENSLINTICFIVNYVIHNLSIILSKDYETKFLIASSKIHNAYQEKASNTIAAYIEKYLQRKNIAKTRIELVKQQKNLAELQLQVKNKKDKINQISSKIADTQNGHKELADRFLRDFANLTQEISSLKKEIKTLENEISQENQKIIKLQENPLNKLGSWLLKSSEEKLRQEINQIEGCISSKSDNLKAKNKILLDKISDSELCQNQIDTFNGNTLEDLYPELKQLQLEKSDILLEVLELETQIQKATGVYNIQKNQFIRDLGGKIDLEMQSAAEIIFPSSNRNEIPHIELAKPKTDREFFLDTITNPNQKKLLAALIDHTHLNIGKLWHIFLNKFESDAIQYWSINDNDEFFLTLKKPLKLWIPKQSQDDPNGGSILILRDKIEGSFDKVNKTIQFNEGFDIFCKHKIGFFEIMVTPHVYKMFYANDDQISIEAGMLGKAESKSKSFDEYLKAWNQGEVVTIEDAAFLKSKS